MTTKHRRLRLVKWTVGLAVAACLLGSCKKRQKGPAFQADDIAVGGAHACAVMKEGFLRCWGRNDLGQLGDGTRANRLRPVRLESPTRVTQVAAGGSTTCATLEDGAAITCWGELAGDTASLHDVAEIAIGPHQACARSKAGKVACWGAGRAPVPVDDLDEVHSIAVGGEHVCAILKEDGSVRCWGKNDLGQLGDGTTMDRPKPVAVSGVRGAIQIATGAAHTCITTLDRTASCWGSNRYGQLGDGTRTDRPSPVPVDRLDAVRAVALGDGHTCARLYDGTLRCWGQNDSGQQNDGTHTDREVPGMISGLFDVQQLALGNGTVCARLADGAVRCWGRNEYGQAGDGTHEERPVPVTVRW
ncbi:RCC1 domain-containing protein [Pendulispora albinea]|uniref:RCC1-like domain-containing protein n=1 Tax=Pendulispora albinea TaxID=2741071 RepID=A0ABZ2LRC1_9BACT